MSNFSKEVQAFVDKSKANCETIIKKVGIDALNEIVLMSPVGQPELWQGNAPAGYVGGRFRGNWQVTFNAPASGTLERIDPTGSMTINEGLEKLLDFNCMVKAIYFTNNLPYSVALEFGHSSQAPNGIVRVAAINAKNKLNELSGGEG